MNPYLKLNPENTNPPYDDATINKFNAASSSALGYLQNRLNDPIYYKRLQNETMQSNKLGNVAYDPKTGAIDLLNQRKKGLNEVKFINPNTTDQSEIAIINEIKNKGYLGAFTTGQTGRYEPEYQKEGFMKGALKQDIAGFQKNVIGVNPVMFNQDYEKYLENILIHEGEHSTQPAYPEYTNPYYNVGNYNVDNGTLPLYRNLSNITPYATNVIKENISSDDKYYSDPMEVVASKRQVEHLFEKAPEGTFKKTWKYGDDIQDEHFNYFLKGNNNTQADILKKALLGDRTIVELSEEEKKDLKVRFSNIMTKIAYNENNNDNIYTARFGTKVKGKNANPYIKKYQNGGANNYTDPPTYSWGTSSVQPVQQPKMANTFGSGHSQTQPSVMSAQEIENRKKAELAQIVKTEQEKENIRQNEYGPGYQIAQVPIDNTYTGVNPNMSTIGNVPNMTSEEGFERNKMMEEYRKEALWDAVAAGDKAIGQYLVQPVAELFNTPFATFAEGVNAIQGKKYDFGKALPNPTRMWLNNEGMGDMIPQQQLLSDYLGVDRKENPYLALGLDIFTPGPAMATKPLQALTGIGKASTGAIKYASKMNALDRAIDNPIAFAKKELNPNALLKSNKKIAYPLKSVDGDVVTDSQGYKINTVETQKFIENEGRKIVQETINTPEGRKRLAAQFKQEDPWLTNAEIDDLVEIRINEVKAAVTHNEPKFWNEAIRADQSFISDEIKKYWFNDIFPNNNAYYKSSNRYYPIHSSNVKSASPNTNTNRFIDSQFTPGSITLGRRHEKNLATLDHEIGHAIGHYGELPLDKKLVELVKPKSIPDYLWELATILNRPDRNYFLKSFNEPYAFLRESRRKMLDNNILSSAYEKIDIDKLLKQRLKNDKDERLIRLTPPWKWKKLAELYNEAPAVIPVVGATGAAATIGANQMTQPVSENRNGGKINPYLK